MSKVGVVVHFLGNFLEIASFEYGVIYGENLNLKIKADKVSITCVFVMFSNFVIFCTVLEGRRYRRVSFGYDF